MTDRELMQMALDSLLRVWHSERNIKHSEAIETLRGRLAQPEQEPVAWMHDSHVGFNVPLYTATPQREWQGLTDEEIWSDGDSFVTSEAGIKQFARAIEAKLKEKNAPASPS